MIDGSSLRNCTMRKAKKLRKNFVHVCFEVHVICLIIYRWKSLCMSASRFMWYKLTPKLIATDKSKDLIVNQKRSARSCVAVIAILVTCTGGDLRLSNASEWSTTLRAKPGLKKSRHAPQEYATGVAGRRGVVIGHNNEKILWPADLNATFKRVCGGAASAKVLLLEYRHAIIDSNNILQQIYNDVC